MLGQSDASFGTFKGVFLPSVLTVLGVIMYLRLSWVLGVLGLSQTVIVIVLAHIVTLFTSLSLASIATNMNVKGGGTYYIISRSLGLEAGVAIAVPLFFAQALGVSFYVIGFTESFTDFLARVGYTGVSSQTIGLIILPCLTLLAFISPNLALKMQAFIFLVITLSLVSFFWGADSGATVVAREPFVSLSPGFWYGFAIFFPAVTGIEAGLSMSGTLANPKKSLPLGTLAAVVVGFVVYLAITFVLHMRADPRDLVQDKMIFHSLAKYGKLVDLGIWGASLSSALGGLLAGPQTLQALSKDKIIPFFYNAKRSSTEAPREALLLTAVIAGIALFTANLDSVAQLLTMFFLASYGMVNFTAFLESFLSNPSWRPEFRVKTWISLAGALLCFCFMFLIDSGFALFALMIIFTLYFLTHRKRVLTYWGDLRAGLLLYITKFSLVRLASMTESTKSWRPNILVLLGSPTKRKYLIELAHGIASDKSFLTIGSVVPRQSTIENRINETKKTLYDYFKRKNISSFVHIIVADSIEKGRNSLISNYGFGPLRPNTVVMGCTAEIDGILSFVECLIKAHQEEKNLLLVRYHDEGFIKSKETKDNRLIRSYLGEDKETKVAIWWGRKKRNAGLSMVCSFLLQNNANWPGTKLHLKSIVLDQKDLEISETILAKMISEANIHADCETYHLDLGSDENSFSSERRAKVFSLIKSKSEDFQLIFIGMKEPDLNAYILDREGYIKKYAEYYRQLMELTKDFPPTVFVMARDEIDFHKIFTS